MYINVILIKKYYCVSVLLANVTAIVFVRKIPFKSILNIKASINMVRSEFVFSEILIKHQLRKGTRSSKYELVCRILTLTPTYASFFSWVVQKFVLTDEFELLFNH